MSRRTPARAQKRDVKRPVRSAVKSPAAEPHEPAVGRLVRWLIGLPRAARIVIVGLFALAITFTVSPVVDILYLSYFYTEETRVLPSLVSAGLGLLFYMVGWTLIVGTIGDDPPARIGVLWYFGLGIATILLALMLLALGWASGSAPA